MANDTFRDTAKEHVRETSPPMRAHDDEISLFAANRLTNRGDRFSDHNPRLHDDGATPLLSGKLSHPLLRIGNISASNRRSSGR